MTWREPTPPRDWFDLQEHDDVNNSEDQLALFCGGIVGIIMLACMAMGGIWIMSRVVAWICP